MFSPDRYVFACCAFMLLAMSTAAQTVSIPVPDFSFESQILRDGGWTTNVAGWTGFSNGKNQSFGVENSTAAKFPGQSADTDTYNAPADGKNAAYLNTGGRENGMVTITSDVVTTIADNTHYTLTVAVGNPLGGGTSSPGSFSISFLVNDSIVATTGLMDPAPEGGPNQIKDGSFKDFIFTLPAPVAREFVGQKLSIQFGHVNTGTNHNAQIFFDNVRLTATTTSVPGPGN